MSFCSSVAEPAAPPTAASPEILRPAGHSRDRRGRLLRGYLHKSSNSLCGIKGYASLIAGGPQSPGRTTSWARKIIDEVERLEVAYRSVRDMAFPEPGAPFGGGRLTSIVRDAQAAAEARHSNLTVIDATSDDGRPMLPAGDLLQILAAVLDNAAESRPGPVDIEVTTASNGDRLTLSLADNGPGMGHELLAQAIDPFVTTRDGHLGIGLARVDTIMDMHGLGWALRSATDQGTTVTLEVAAAIPYATRI